MIIKDIKLSRNLFGKNELFVVFDSGKTKIKINPDNSSLENLKGKLIGKELNNLEDLKFISRIINEVYPEIKRSFELGIINYSKYGWGMINNEIKQIPRPMCRVFQKDKGIKEIYLISLNSSSFDGVVNASRDISNLIEKKLQGGSKIDDEELLILVKECVDEIFKDIDFELRICVKFDNYDNGKYIYYNKSLNEEEQLKFVEKIIKVYDLFFVENPFHESNLESYTKLNNQVGKKCLVCLDSKINEYTQGVDEKSFNTAVLKYEDVNQFSSDVKFLKENKINIVMDDDVDLINVLVGFSIPIVKFNNASEIINKLIDVTEAIREKQKAYK